MEESLVHIASLNDKEGPDNAISFPVGENHCYVSVSVMLWSHFSSLAYVWFRLFL